MMAFLIFTKQTPLAKSKVRPPILAARMADAAVVDQEHERHRREEADRRSKRKVRLL
jgi:hypothetical protein